MTYEYEFINHMKGTLFNAFLVTIYKRHYHWHNDLELLLVIEGSVIVNTADKEYLLKKDDLFLLNCNEVHSLAKTKENNTLIALQFDSKLSKTYYPMLQRIRFLEKKIDKSKFPDCYNALRNYLLDFVMDYYKKERGYEFKLMSILNMMIYYLIRWVPYKETEESKLRAEKKNLERLSRIIDYMEENYSQKISLKDLAAREKLDMYYLSHFIKKNLGITFREYVNKKRLEKAVELMTLNKWTNTEIYIEAGFSDNRYLCNAFIKEFGCTPSQFRQHYKDLEFPEVSSAKKEQHKFFSPYEAIEKIMSYSAGQ